MSARATLLALRAAFPDAASGPRDAWIIPPSVAPLPYPMVLERLSAFPKPVLCAAFPIGGVVVLGCWPLLDEPVLREYVAAESATLARAVRESVANGEARLLLRGAGEELLLTVEEAARWAAEYYLPFVSTRVVGASAEERARGATVAMEFAPAGDAGLSGWPRRRHRPRGGRPRSAACTPAPPSPPRRPRA